MSPKYTYMDLSLGDLYILILKRGGRVIKIEQSSNNFLVHVKVPHKYPTKLLLTPIPRNYPRSA